MPDYTSGIASPRLRPDPGSGPWCSLPQTARFLLYKRALETALDTRALFLYPGPDAARHMQHYLRNTGQDLPVDVGALMARSAQLSRQYAAELAAAQSYAQTLPPGRHAIASTRPAQGYFRQRDDADLFFAVGGYSYWGHASVTVLEHSPDDRRYDMDFEFEFYDRYNWDSGKQVVIAGITVTDAFMQNFHRQCYAREYDLRGSLSQRLHWRHGQPPQAVRPLHDGPVVLRAHR